MKTRTLVTAALLIALGVALNYINLPLPFFPEFLKYTPADIPTLLGTFALGPIVGSIIAVARAILHSMTPATTTPLVSIGTGMDILTSVTFAAVAGTIYHFNRTRKGALIALLAGVLVTMVIATPVNYFFAYPAYGGSDMAPLALMPGIPFNLLKYTINALLVFLLYKPLSPLLHGRQN